MSLPYAVERCTATQDGTYLVTYRERVNGKLELRAATSRTPLSEGSFFMLDGTKAVPR